MLEQRVNLQESHPDRRSAILAEESRQLARAHITANRNAVPNDPKPPFVTSGIRVSAAPAPTRGFGVAECRQLAGGMCDVLDAIHDDDVALCVRRQVRARCQRLPVYCASGREMRYGN